MPGHLFDVSGSGGSRPPRAKETMYVKSGNTVTFFYNTEMSSFTLARTYEHSPSSLYPPAHLPDPAFLRLQPRHPYPHKPLHNKSLSLNFSSLSYLMRPVILCLSTN